MINLKQNLDTDFDCPKCKVHLDAHGWYMPGMRTLAELKCPDCGNEFYGDLPSGHGLYYPALLEKNTGKVHNNYKVDWYASWLEESYRNKTSDKVSIHQEVLRPVKRPIILNCLDVMYGHSLLSC